MTKEEVQAYYKNLLILQYHGKPKASATVGLLADLGVMDFLPLEVQDGFDLETAIGKQLDVIGKYVNISRNVKTLSGFKSLDDSDYRTLVKITIAKNNSGSSLFEIQQILDVFFSGTLRIFDFKNMGIGYYFNSSFGSQELAEIFVLNDFLPRPMGVSVASVIYSDDISQYFGLRSYWFSNDEATGLNSYTEYDLEAQWLSYADTL